MNFVVRLLAFAESAFAPTNFVLPIYTSIGCPETSLADDFGCKTIALVVRRRFGA